MLGFFELIGLPAHSEKELFDGGSVAEGLTGFAQFCQSPDGIADGLRLKDVDMGVGHGPQQLFKSIPAAERLTGLDRGPGQDDFFDAPVFERRLDDGRVPTFGVSGKLKDSNLIMYDRQTETWWQQFTGDAIVGERAGLPSGSQGRPFPARCSGP